MNINFPFHTLMQYNTTTYYYIVRHYNTKLVSFFAMYFSFVIMADINIGLYCKNLNLFVQSHVSIYICTFDLIRFSEPVLWWVCEILVSHSTKIHSPHSLVHCCKGTMMFVIFKRFHISTAFFLLLNLHSSAIRISMKLILEFSLRNKIQMSCMFRQI